MMAEEKLILEFYSKAKLEAKHAARAAAHEDAGEAEEGSAAAKDEGDGASGVKEESAKSHATV